MKSNELSQSLLDVWRLFYCPNTVVEFRIPKAGKSRTVSGYFTEPDALLRAVQQWDGSAQGLYITLNPVKRDLLARANNTAKPYAESTTSDTDIEHRRWLLVDFDPVRPSGISASEDEHKAALRSTMRCQKWLQEQYAIDCVSADSGNGGHLLLPIDLPNTPESTLILKRVLAALALECDEETVKVDLTTFNAARITKLYGTLAAKGDNLAERPHRRSRLLEVPDSYLPTPAQTLQTIAARLPEPVRESASKNHHNPFDLGEFLQRHGIAITREKPYAGGMCFQLATCPFNPEHTSPDAAIFRFADGRLAFRCLHHSCEGKGWIEFREHYEPGYRDASRRLFVNDLPSSSAKTIGDVQPPHPVRQTVAWPAPLAEEAFHGIAGKIVRTLAPETEADPAALLFQLLTGYGSLIGRNAYFFVAGVRHYVNLFCCIVGQSAVGGKGTSWAMIREILTLAEAGDAEMSWAKCCVKMGLSSGEGLIWHVRDPVMKSVPVKDNKTKQVTGTEIQCVDEGVEDKRLQIVESEFSSVLDVMNREKNILSAILRAAWESGTLNQLVKNYPAKATDAHISLIGHITNLELRRKLTETDQANGFANRVLWVAVKRSQCLPFGGRLSEEIKTGLAADLHAAIEFGQQQGMIDMNTAAKRLWCEVYPELTEERPGMRGAIVARAAPYTVRLALIYALLDQSSEITPEHLTAALAVWQYAEDSANYIFGDSLGDPVADDILRELRQVYPAGLTRTDLYHFFNKHKKSDRIGEALKVLEGQKLAHQQHTPSDGGRPIETWFATLDEETSND